MIYIVSKQMLFTRCVTQLIKKWFSCGKQTKRSHTFAKLPGLPVKGCIMDMFRWWRCSGFFSRNNGHSASDVPHKSNRLAVCLPCGLVGGLKQQYLCQPAVPLSLSFSLPLPPSLSLPLSFCLPLSPLLSLSLSFSVPQSPYFPPSGVLPNLSFPTSLILLIHCPLQEFGQTLP